MKLSIITVNLNNADGLCKTIESVVSQTFTDYEYIVIDGGSIDGSVDIVKQYVDKITYWVSEPDRRIYNAMNKGILVSKGEYVLFLNSGDVLFEKTTIELVFKQNRSEDFLYGDEIILTKQGKIYGYYPESLDFGFLRRNGLPHQSTFIKRELFIDSLYNEDLKIVSDWEFVLNQIVFNDKSSCKLNQIISVFDGAGISSNKQLKAEEKRLVLKTMFKEKIYIDYYNADELYRISTLPLFPYVEIFSKYIGLQCWVKRIMKLVLILSGNKTQIPDNKQKK